MHLNTAIAQEANIRADEPKWMKTVRSTVPPRQSPFGEAPTSSKTPGALTTGPLVLASGSAEINNGDHDRERTDDGQVDAGIPKTTESATRMM